MAMALIDWGFTEDLEHYRKDKALEGFETARVIAEHKERYRVLALSGEYDAEILGNLRYTAKDRSDFPAVGDWVAVSVYDSEKALIHAVYPRKSVLERQSAGKQGEKQVIAANIDCALIVQAVDRDFNLNRLERYLTLCHQAGMQTHIVLSKTDLLNEGEADMLMEKVRDRTRADTVIPISNITENGWNTLVPYIKKGITYCLLGSSGAGKSSLLNRLAGEPIMETGAISQSTNKGRHITSHRQLHILRNGGIIIDNPGIREVGIADAEAGLEQTFAEISALARECKFNNCTHTNETGCRVLEALNKGEVDKEAYRNYLRLERENEHFMLTLAEKRRKDKDFGKMLKDFKRQKKYISNKHDD